MASWLVKLLNTAATLRQWHCSLCPERWVETHDETYESLALAVKDTEILKSIMA